MKKIKFLYITIIVLVLLNAFTLLFFYLNRPEGGKGQLNPKMIVIEKLHFDTVQKEAYDKLISVHEKDIKALDNAIRDAKKELYSNLSQPQNTISNDSLYNVIASSQAQIEKVHYKHFLDIRNICKPNQMKDFEKLSDELSKLFGMPNRPRK